MKSFPCPKDHIHQDHNKSRHGYRCPKPHIDSEQLRSSEQIHPYCVPIDCHIMHTPFLLQQLPKMTHIGFLNTGRQHHIQQNAGDQVSKISCGEGDKSEHFSQCGKGDDRQYRDAGKGQQRHRGRGAALDKRQFRGSDHVDHQRLAPHGFHKPPGMEHGRISSLHLCQFRSSVMSRQVIIKHAAGNEYRAENEVHKRYLLQNGQEQLQLLQ